METEVKVAIFTGIFVVLATGIQYGEPIIDYIHNLIYPAPIIPEPIHDDTGDLLFSDYFSNNNSGWETPDYGNLAKIYYANNELNFDISNNSTVVYLSNQSKYTPPRNYIVEVDTTQRSEQSSSGRGVALRLNSGSDQYRFEITGDGHYQFYKSINYKIENIVGPQISTHINSGDATNTLKVKCNGSIFTLYINNAKLITCEDDKLATGNIALYAGPGAHVSFDNFKIWSIK
jgi:hypothetical protein